MDAISPKADSGTGAEPPAAHPSAMRRRFNWIAELIAGALFKHVVINDRAVEKIRELSSRGTVVYAMRQRSLVDYLLLNYVLRREGLPLPVFANGVTATILAPLSDIIKRLSAILRSKGTNESARDHDACAEAVVRSQPVLVFMRGRRRSRGASSQQLSAEVQRGGMDYLREIVHAADEGERFVVPMALFRGHSFLHRTSGRDALIYSVQEMPSETRKFLTYIVNRRHLFITVGTEVDVHDFVARYPEDTQDKLVRRLGRAIKIFLSREERVVLGPALLSPRKVNQHVLNSAMVTEGIERLAVQTGKSPAQLTKEAEKYLEEMASAFNGVLFGFVAYVFKKLWGRMFQGIEQVGFEKVIDKVRDHAVVFVPCHRSHLDYLIISYLCHLWFVSPPHIFAGINMAFWPMTPLLRASGAFFVRRSFADDPLYKLVFKGYLMFLLREGYTQEFFIEGGRSRTGKIMTPRLGMLTALVNAHLSGVRKDLYLCPVSIHYGRIVEEEAYERELTGEDKEAESFGALIRARRFLQQRYGTAYVSFAEPISLNEALGDRKDALAAAEQSSDPDPEVDAEKKRFIRKLGFRILREVNECSIAGASSISATVLLSSRHGARIYESYRRQANALVDLIEFQGIGITASLERNRGNFRESLGFLSSNGLIEMRKRGSEEFLVVPDKKRVALDFYKNNLIHAFLVPSLLTFCLLAGKKRSEWVDEIAWWLDLLRYEFALSGRDELEREVAVLEAYYDQCGATIEGVAQSDHPLIRATAGVIDNFRDAYWIAARSCLNHVGESGISEKELTAGYRKDYEAALLLGESTRPEGATVVTLGNALNRLQELGYVRRETIQRPGRRRRAGAREQRISRGEHFGELAEFVDSLAEAVALGRLPQQSTKEPSPASSHQPTSRKPPAAATDDLARVRTLENSGDGPRPAAAPRSRGKADARAERGGQADEAADGDPVDSGEEARG